MTCEWHDCRWGDLITLEYGKGLRGYEDSDGPYPVYGTNGPIGRHSVALCNHPGVVIGRKGAYRGIHYSGQPFYVIDTAFFLKPKKDINLKWAYYELLTHDINSMDSGSAIPSTSREAFYSLPVKVPPLPEQQAIAHILGALDDKIELNRQMNETLEGIARTLFKSWFVDFDPVRAKMEGRQPHGMDAEIAELFPDGFEDSVLGKIPKRWEIKKFLDLILISKKSIEPNQHLDETFSHYSIPAFDTGYLPAFEKGSQIKSNKFLIPKNAVLLSKINPAIPRTWFPFIEENKYRSICSTEFLVVLPRGAISTEYLYALFNTGYFRERFVALTTGTSNSHQRVRPEYLLDMDILVPDLKLVEHFTDVVQPLYKKMSQNLIELQILSLLRDTLLPKLLSGAIRVKDAEKAVESVL